MGFCAVKKESLAAAPGTGTRWLPLGLRGDAADAATGRGAYAAEERAGEAGSRKTTVEEGWATG
jgi:hypothetical protein